IRTPSARGVRSCLAARAVERASRERSRRIAASWFTITALPTGRINDSRLDREKEGPNESFARTPASSIGAERLRLVAGLHPVERGELREVQFFDCLGLRILRA